MTREQIEMACKLYGLEIRKTGFVGHLEIVPKAWYSGPSITLCKIGVDTEAIKEESGRYEVVRFSIGSSCTYSNLKKEDLSQLINEASTRSKQLAQMVRFLERMAR
jgi:hypothetical protein